MKTLKLFAALSVSLLLCSCAGTVRPKQVQDTVIAFDGNEQTAGFLGFLPNHGGGVITDTKRREYNALVDRYGKLLVPPITAHDDGLKAYTNGTWVITKARLTDFGVMKGWLRSGL